MLMAELDISDVVSGIEQSFHSHQFVFWYDPKQEFKDNIDEIKESLDARVIEMDSQEQFKTKLELLNIEKQSSTSKVLVYSPAPKPTLSENFLTDMLECSAEYTADAAVMLRKSLGLPEEDQGFINEQKKFFGSKERIAKFKQLYQPGKNLKQVEMAVLAKASEVKLTSILQSLFSQAWNDDNSILEDFKKYDVLADFWQFVSQAYLDANGSYKKLYSAFYLALTVEQMDIDVPSALSTYKVTNAHNAINFIQNTRNNLSYNKTYSNTAMQVWDFLDLDKVFNEKNAAQIIRSDVFQKFDWIILQWINKQLIDGNFNAELDHLTLNRIIEKRKKMYFHSMFSKAYDMLADALMVLAFQKQYNEQTLDEQADNYVSQDYEIDQAYRHFSYAFHTLDTKFDGSFDALRSKVENGYLNQYLAPSIDKWATSYDPKKIPQERLQRNFYSRYLKDARERTVVIVSDAFRFEAAQELESKLDDQDVYNTKMDFAISGLPSVTYFGMPSLLPHKKLEYEGQKVVTVDDQVVDDREKRKRLIQSYVDSSDVGGIDEFLNWNTAQRKEFLVNKKVIYLYHNQVDAVGDNAKTENEVFDATRKAIEEIVKTINYLRNVSVSHIIVTADHGYLYRQSSLDSADKSVLPEADYERKNLRYAITKEPIETTMGVAHQSIGDILNSDNQENVYYPTNPNVFKVPGAGQNYVHGGASLQEMVVPVLQINTQSGKSQAEPVSIKLLTSNRRITSRDVSLSILQEKPISDVAKETAYLMYFVDKNGQTVSGKIRYVANETSQDVNQRMHNVQLTLNDQSFDNHDPYYLIIQNEENGQQQKIEFQMDLVIGGDFGFDI